MQQALHALASDLIGEITPARRAHYRDYRADRHQVAASETTLTALHDIGTLLAGKILALVGNIPNSATTLRAAGITRANAPPVKAIEKHCAV